MEKYRVYTPLPKTKLKKNRVFSFQSLKCRVFGYICSTIIRNIANTVIYVGNNAFK